MFKKGSSCLYLLRNRMQQVLILLTLFICLSYVMLVMGHVAVTTTATTTSNANIMFQPKATEAPSSIDYEDYNEDGNDFSDLEDDPGRANGIIILTHFIFGNHLWNSIFYNYLFIFNL